MPTTADGFAINLQNVTKIYRRHIHALQGVSMQVRGGEIFGLLGPNGAGKSTLVKIMVSVVRPTAAQGTILQHAIGHKSTLGRVGYLPENHRFPQYLTGRQVIEFFSALAKKGRADRKRRATELLDLVGMTAWADTKISQYSKGMLQRVGLAQTMGAEPDLIILDEPTDGVDPGGRRDIRQVLMHLRDKGATVFINSHLLSELETVCDRVAILVGGCVAKQGSVDELTIGDQCYMFELESAGWPAVCAAFPGAFNSSSLPAAGSPVRGKLADQTWCEFDGAVLRVGKIDAGDVQPIVDALRRHSVIIRKMQLLRPSLEDLFFEATTGLPRLAGRGSAASSGGATMSQTLALIIDAYRDLNARKMFWIVLILSTLVAASFAVLGLTPTGFKILFWDIQSTLFNTKEISPGQFYKWIFINYGLGIWLTWIATGLALISTASLFPDFIATGAIDLYLSKPIGRSRLFLTKYCCGLLFAALQIACFCAASFLVMGLRGGAWEPGIFLAVPIVVLFFSYLFCFCTFVGVLTRSTVAAILLTALFWVFIFSIHTTEKVLLLCKLGEHYAAVKLDKQIENTQSSLDRAEKSAATRPTTRQSEHLAMVKAQLEAQRTTREGMHGTFDRWHGYIFDVKTCFPKTSETIDLLDRALIDNAHLQGVAKSDEQDAEPVTYDFSMNAVPVSAIVDELRGRSLFWIVGTSVIFEAAVLGLAGWIFAVAIFSPLALSIGSLC